MRKKYESFKKGERQEATSGFYFPTSSYQGSISLVRRVSVSPNMCILAVTVCCNIHRVHNVCFHAGWWGKKWHLTTELGTKVPSRRHRLQKIIRRVNNALHLGQADQHYASWGHNHTLSGGRKQHVHETYNPQTVTTLQRFHGVACARLHFESMGVFHCEWYAPLLSPFIAPQFVTSAQFGCCVG